MSEIKIERKTTPGQDATMAEYRRMLGDIELAMTAEGVDPATIHRVTCRLVEGTGEGPRTARAIVEHAPLVATVSGAVGKMRDALDDLAVQAIPVAAIVMREGEGVESWITTVCGYPLIRVATSALEWGIVSTPGPPCGDSLGEIAIGKLRAGLDGDASERAAAHAVIAGQPFWQDPAWWQFRGETETHLDRLARASIPIKAIALRADLWPDLVTHACYPVVAVPADCPFRWGVVT